MASRRRSGRSTAQKRSHSSDGEGDDPFSDLTRPQLLKINRIFDSITSKNPPRPSLDAPRTPPCAYPDQLDEQVDLETEGEDLNMGGGFIVDNEDDGNSFGGGGFIAEEEDVGGGGFIADDEAPQPGGFSTTADQEEDVPADQGIGTSKSSKKPTPARDSIPLRCVPEALRLLELPYMDSDILEVFDQAASSDEEDHTSQAKWVNRRQFTRVCAALMVGEGSDEDGENKDQDSDRPLGSSDSDASFVAPTSPAKRRRTTRGTKTVVSDDSADSDGSFIAPEQSTSKRKSRAKTQTRSSRKKAEKDPELDDFDSVLDNFQLFFPQDAKDRSAITFADIRRIANELNEEMTDAEIKEMLDFASGTNDSCVDLTAFERLLRDIRAV